MFSRFSLLESFSTWSLRWKLLSIILGATAMGIILSLASLSYSIHNIFKNSAIQELTTLSQITSQNSKAALEFQDKRSADEYLKSMGSHSDIIEAAIYDKEGLLFARFSPSGSSQLPQKITHQEITEYKSDKIKLVKPILFHGEIIGDVALLSNNKTYQNLENFLIWTCVGIFLGTLTIVSLMALKMQSWMSKPIISLSKVADEISSGDYQARAQIFGRDEIGNLAKSFNVMVSNLQEIHDSLERQNYIKSKIASYIKNYQEIIRLPHLAQSAISDVCEIIGAGSGAFYIRSDESEKLQLLGSFALTANKKNNSSYSIGEGLIGQCAAEKKPIILTDVPPQYMRIKSGLGERDPLTILTHPVMFNKKICGVLELGVFHPVTAEHQQIVEEIAATLGVIINNIEEREKTNNLLQESQRLTEELQAQQEELKTSNEELEEQTKLLRDSEEKLKTQSEELQVNNEELEQKTKMLQEQKDKLEKTTADIQAAKSQLEQKAAELQLASKYKSEFLANMSHELRTPLNSLLILAKLLMDNESGNLTEEQVESARVIHGSGKDLLTLINDILDLSKVEAGKLHISLRETSPEEILNNVRNLFIPVSKNKGIDFEVKNLVELGETFSTDPGRVEQILKNLLSNAFKFTDSGKVCLNCSYLEKAPEKFRTKWPGAAIEFTVEDTGIGIPQDKQKEIFKAFQQIDGSINRKYGGTGLGLTISQELGRLLGAYIDLESKEGEGSCFHLYLPLHPRTNNIEASKTADEEKTDISPILYSENWEPRQDETPTNFILLIEDDPEYATVLTKLVERKGHSVLHADTGKLGLNLAEKHLPLGIILDMGLPDMHGLEVLEALLSNPITSNIPIHVISGMEENSTAIDKGALGYLMKPIEESDLENIFSQFEQISKGKIHHIMLVEDDGKNQLALSKLLGEKNIRISSVNNGKKALELFAKEKFDGIILDLGLPDMSGFDLIKSFEKEKKDSLPSLIIYTGKDLSKEEYVQLREHTSRIIIKGSHSPERLKSELQTFLLNIHPPKEAKVTHFDPEKLLKGKKILVVDDDLRNNFALSKVLEKHGIRVLIADNGELAIQILGKEGDVDLVLMDIMMPVMDGYEAIRRIRSISKFKKLPILALTAKAMLDDKKKALETGANDYLTKPIDPEKLINIIRLWVFA